MENKNEDKLDRLIARELKSLPLETPSANFTHQVMVHLSKEKMGAATIYKPLISWKVWVGVLIGFVLIAMLFSGSTTDGNWMGMVNFEMKVPDIESFFSKYKGLKPDQTLLLTTSSLGLLLMGYLFLLKRHFDRRMGA